MTSRNHLVLPQERMLPMGQICKRYGVTDRTIDRWLERGVLPAPIRINRFRYWRESDLVQFERKQMSAHKPDNAA